MLANYGVLTMKDDWIFHYTVTDDLTITCTWDKCVSHKIYHTSWKPKPENIKILTEGLSKEVVIELQNEINANLKPELDHYIKKRGTK